MDRFEQSKDVTVDTYLKFLTNFDFKGRADRSEYWTVSTATLCIAVGFVITAALLNASIEIMTPLLILFFLGTAVQSFALCIRRIHDINASGWLFLATFIPFVGFFVMMGISLMPGTKGRNKFGADPSGPNSLGDKLPGKLPMDKQGRHKYYKNSFEENCVRPPSKSA